MSSRNINRAAALALLFVVAGVPVFLFDQKAAVGMEAIGWAAVCIVGTIAESRTPTTPERSDD